MRRMALFVFDTPARVKVRRSGQAWVFRNFGFTGPQVIRSNQKASWPMAHLDMN